MLFFYGLSAFQGCFTDNFPIVLGDFMILITFFGFWGKNLGILNLPENAETSHAFQPTKEPFLRG